MEMGKPPVYEILPLQQLPVGKNNFSRLNFCIYGISISHPITLGSKTQTHTHTHWLSVVLSLVSKQLPSNFNFPKLELRLNNINYNLV